MSYFSALDVSASGLSVQRARMDLISQNIANVDTNGYKRKSLIVEEKKVDNDTFQSILKSKMNNENDIQNLYDKGAGVRVTRIYEDKEGTITIYDPDDPSADENGYVTKSNVNVVEEMVNMISALIRELSNGLRITAV